MLPSCVGASPSAREYTPYLGQESSVAERHVARERKNERKERESPGARQEDREAAIEKGK